mmetsp:Transcript_51752/g.133601  ORF Transcript_51752/g.133601 Transcript_51752/m.133601 type:complete len:380 (-) Transcript_51752:82-1221(-)
MSRSDSSSSRGRKKKKEDRDKRKRDDKARDVEPDRGRSRRGEEPDSGRSSRKEEPERARASRREEPREEPDRGRPRRSDDDAPVGDGRPSGLLDQDGGQRNLRPSGLLDGGDDDADAPAPRGRGAAASPAKGSQEVNKFAARSRSREERPPPRRGPPPPPSGSFGPPRLGGFDGGKGGGKGKDFGGFDGKGGGKGKGKGKDGGKDGPLDGEEQAPKEEPNFEASGLLGLEDNSKNGVPLKFTMPPECRLPPMKWRIYIFTKQEEKPKIVHVHRMLGILFGKDRRVADIPTDHPTCSKQQAVLHYRYMPEMGMVNPYIMDLESTNGTFLNGKRLEPARYYEMRERDVLKFGMSSREFVLLHAGSANHMKIDPSKLLSDSE